MFSMHVRGLRSGLAFLALLLLSGWSGPAAADGLLDQIEQRGRLLCGVSANATGFSTQSQSGDWRGFDVDFCRAVAAAIFDDPKKVEFVASPARDRYAALQSGAVDLIAGGPSWTRSRDLAQKFLYVATSYHDGQGVMLHKSHPLASSRDFGSASDTGFAICLQQGSSMELDLLDYQHVRNIEYPSVLAPTVEEAAKAYEGGKCAGLSAELSTLSAIRASLLRPEDHVVLPLLISKAPHGPIVRQGDDQWFNVVRWTFFALIDAEELGVASANVDESLKSERANVRRLLGVDGAQGEGLGLSADWVYKIVKHVGNYGEIFERNLGRGSSLDMERGLDQLWSKGGLLFAPSMR